MNGIQNKNNQQFISGFGKSQISLSLITERIHPLEKKYYCVESLSSIITERILFLIKEIY